MDLRAARSGGLSRSMAVLGLLLLMCTLLKVEAGDCDRCNRPESQGGCKCDNNCDCLGAPSKCNKCNLPVEQGGCKCDDSCDCKPETATPPPAQQPAEQEQAAAIGIGWESGATYDYNFVEAQTLVNVWARTKTGSNGPEQKPDWPDCTLAINKLRGACGPDIRKWECRLMWGFCGKCNWGSCIWATFQAPAICATSLEFGAGIEQSKESPSVGLSFGVGMTKLGDVVTGIFGQPSCDP